MGVVERLYKNSSGFVENNLYCQMAYVLFSYKIIIKNDEAENRFTFNLTEII